MNLSLAGQVALVTGGSRGIGASICLSLAEAGAKVLMNYRSNRSQAEEVLKKLQEKSPDSELLPFDIAKAEEMEAAVTGSLKKHGKISILVCNAGISRDVLLPRATDEGFREVLNTNLIGHMNLVRLVSRSMMKDRYGRIIFIGSVIGEIGNKGQTAYAASKSALFGFAKSVALELGSRGVTSNVICPGFIETEMTQSLPEEVQRVYLGRIPVERFGKPEEVADCVRFLASESAGYITGATLDINGGLVMR